MFDIVTSEPYCAPRIALRGSDVLSFFGELDRRPMRLHVNDALSCSSVGSTDLRFRHCAPFMARYGDAHVFQARSAETIDTCVIL